MTSLTSSIPMKGTMKVNADDLLNADDSKDMSVLIHALK